MCQSHCHVGLSGTSVMYRYTPQYYLSTPWGTLEPCALTGYNQSVTGCGSQQRQCSCYSSIIYVDSVFLALNLKLTLLRNIYIESGLC